MNANLKRRQGGFTLLELVVVIVIIGILAAVAVPKFFSLSADARGGAIKGVSGALASANVAVYSAAQTAATPQTGATGSVTACGGTVATVFGYASNLTELTKCTNLTPPGDFTVAATTISHAGAAAGTNCRVTYVAAASGTVAPTYTVDVTNCN